jgi:hypothetical protein
MRTVSSEIEIAASPEQVWGVLADLDSYPEWNPFITHIKGELEMGRRLSVRIQPPGGRAMSFRPTVVTALPGRQLAWLGRLLAPGIFDGEHRFEIARGDGGVRFRQSEVFRGMLVPMMGSVLEKTRAGFEQMNQALKVRAERRDAPSSVKKGA